VTRSTLTKVAIPVAIVAAGLFAAYLLAKPDDSGVVVRVAPRDAAAYVRITPAAKGDMLAGGRIDAGATARYTLDPGSYVVRPRDHGRWRAAAVPVEVRAGRFAPVLVRFRRVARH
jgi:hypothetical protein